MVYRSRIARQKKDDFDYIRQYVRRGDMKGLAKVVQARAKQINQRLYRIEKQGLEKSSYAYKRTLEEEGKARYTTSLNVLNKMTRNELIQQAYDIQSKLSSKTSKIREVKRLNEYKLNRSLEELNKELKEVRGDIEIDKNDLRKFIEQGGGEIFNNRFYQSNQVSEDWQDALKNGISTEEFIGAYNEYMSQEEKSFNYQKFLDKLKAIKKG